MGIYRKEDAREDIVELYKLLFELGRDDEGELSKALDHDIKPRTEKSYLEYTFDKERP